MILVYSDTISSRLTYVLNVIFKYVLGVDYKLIRNLNDFKNSNLPKLNYSNSSVVNTAQIIPSSLLFSKEITIQNVEVDWVDEIPFFFKTKQNEYDILASSFWMLSRYEEYLPFESDNHNRFSGTNSLAFKEGFLKKPVVNYWCEILKNKIKEYHPEVNFRKRQTSFINSLDIDVAYIYKGKPIWRFLAGFVKSIFKNDKEDVKLRLDYIKSKKDVFDTYDFIKLHAKNIKTTYFFLLGNKSKFDLNIQPRKRVLKKLIQECSKNNDIGIHPSYMSNQNLGLLGKEIKRLEKITSKKVAISRQHFLKLEFPKTYENLISHDISVDYSMGYADQIGFRAGICNAYPFYNLRLEQERPLWIVPFQVMDGTLNKYLKLSPEQAIDETRNLIDEVKKVKGLYVSLWHNSSLSEIDIWKGWRIVYEEALNLMK